MTDPRVGAAATAAVPTLAAELSARLGTDLGLTSIEGIQAEIERVVPTFAGAELDLLGDPGRQDGVLVPVIDDTDWAEAGLPERLAFVAPEVTQVPAISSYSFRLVLTRRLYDRGTMLGAMPSSAPLATSSELRMNPADFGQLGIAEGAELTVRSPSGSVTVPARSDHAVARGTLELNAGAQPGALALCDPDQPLTEVRVETLDDPGGSGHAGGAQ